MKEGISYVFKTKELLGAITLDLFAVLFGGAVALVPVFAKDILNIGPIGFGWLNAAADIGSIITVTTLTISPPGNKQGRTLFFAVAGFGLCIILFAISKVFWLSFVALLLSGCMDGGSVIVKHDPSIKNTWRTPRQGDGRKQYVHQFIQRTRPVWKRWQQNFWALFLLLYSAVAWQLLWWSLPGSERLLWGRWSIDINLKMHFSLRFKK